MSSDPQPAGPGRTPPETVVEFGPDPEAPRPERRRWSATELAVGLAADRRAVPLAAAVGAVALFASLISEWQITELDSDQIIGGGANGNRPLPAGVTDLGALGGAYLGGLFVLTGAVVLVLFGPPPARRYARLIGLSTGGVLIAVLAALVSALGDTSRTVLAVFTLELEEGQMRLSYGRGIWCAFFGVAMVVLALYLAGRHDPALSETAPETASDHSAAPAPVVWSWRRPRDDEDDDERQPDAPFDLTVSSTKPFTPLTDDRDKPS